MSSSDDLRERAMSSAEDKRRLVLARENSDDLRSRAMSSFEDLRERRRSRWNTARNEAPTDTMKYTVCQISKVD